MWGYLLLLPLCQSIEGNAQNFLDDKLKSAAENIYKFLLTTHLQPAVAATHHIGDNNWFENLYKQVQYTQVSVIAIAQNLAVFQRRNTLQQGSRRGWTTHEANNWRRLSPHRAISHKIGQFCSSLISTSLSFEIVETGCSSGGTGTCMGEMEYKTTGFEVATTVICVSCGTTNQVNHNKHRMSAVSLPWQSLLKKILPRT